jgi:hypothetical protein
MERSMIDESYGALGKKAILVDGYVYTYHQEKYDTVGKRYQLNLKKYWIDFYSRKKPEYQYSICYKNVSIFISEETPFVQNSKNSNEILSTINKAWIELADYALNKCEPNWIMYSESDKNVYENTSREKAISYLGISEDILNKVRAESSYSYKEDVNGAERMYIEDFPLIKN